MRRHCIVCSGTLVLSAVDPRQVLRLLSSAAAVVSLAEAWRWTSPKRQHLAAHKVCCGGGLNPCGGPEAGVNLDWFTALEDRIHVAE